MYQACITFTSSHPQTQILGSTYTGAFEDVKKMSDLRASRV